MNYHLIKNLPEPLKGACKALTRKCTAYLTPYTSKTARVDAGWQGGSKDAFWLVDLKTGALQNVTTERGFPVVTPNEIDVPEGKAIIRCGIFLGKPAQPSIVFREKADLERFTPGKEVAQ